MVTKLVRKVASIQTVGVLALVAAAGCGQADAIDESGNDVGEITYGTNAHILPTRMPGERPAPSLNPTVASAHLVYYGGKVLSNVKVVQVLYGSGTYISGISGSGSGTMAGFYQAVTNSTYIDMLTQYNTPSQKIGRGSYSKSVQITPSASRNKATISDASIEAEIAAQIKSGVLPAPDANTVYMINFPKGKKISMGGSGSCASGGFCAYHSTFKNGTTEIYYGVLPDMGSGSGCDVGCGSNNAFARQTSVASHELIESITDPEVGLATSLGPPLAWYDNTNGEIGDICNSDGSITGYTVQTEWSNKAGACVDH
jgi:hypothetical protein